MAQNQPGGEVLAVFDQPRLEPTLIQFSFNRFLNRKDEALAQKDAEAEQRAREALLAELVWAE